MSQRLFLASSLMLLANCADIQLPAATHAALAVAAPVRAAAPVINPVDYLAQARCQDGSMPLVSACAAPVAQLGTDRMLWRRHDWPAPNGYQVEDAIRGTHGIAQLNWSYAPYGPFVAANGDGGEVYALNGTRVIIAETQDGGTPGMQTFVGPACGGTGWVLFDTANLPAGSWASTTARLSSAAPGACPPLGQSFTRWRRETVVLPFILFGRPTPESLDTIISEHFDGATIAASQHLERSFFARGMGRAVWEAWGTTRPAITDLAIRCPGTAWSQPPAAGWVLEDCRYATNIVADGGALPSGWPPQ